MNREILFKAKRLDNGEWTQGNLITRIDYSDDLCSIDRAGIECRTGFGRFQVDMNTVCQFTGLIDKNGNKIFEGDKLYDNENEQECFIVYVEEEAGFSVRFFDDVYFYSFSEIYPSNLEIIGNIHDREV